MMDQTQDLSLDASFPFTPSTTHYLSPPPDSDFICPQDVERSAEQDTSSPSPTSASSPSPDDDSSAPPKKKRKSWGQVLPQPTTQLPPRKRAKTEAEKEQRKYERVQRNRQAAHNSRMRKQEEMDNLSKKNKELERRCQDQRTEIERLKQALVSFGGHPPLSPTISLAEPPSLDSASPSDTSSSTDYDQVSTPLDIKLEPDHGFGMKFDDSHSAEIDFLMDMQSHTQDQNLSIDQFLNLGELSDSVYPEQDIMSWNTDLGDPDVIDTSFMDDFSFDLKSAVGTLNLEPFNLDNFESTPLNNTQLDPPMFTLPGQGA